MHSARVRLPPHRLPPGDIFKWTCVCAFGARYICISSQSTSTARINMMPDCQSVESDCAGETQINCGRRLSFCYIAEGAEHVYIQHNAFLSGAGAIYQCRVIAHITLSSAKVGWCSRRWGSSRWKVCSPART